MSRRFSKVAVLMGGGSSESEISIQSGTAVAAALAEAGYDVSRVVVSQDNAFVLPEGTEAAFIMLHGAYGEDGGVQADLEKLGVPYVGCGVEASRVSFDKILSREAFAAAGVPIPEGYVVREGEEAAACRLPLPVVVKAPRQGSSVGVSIVRSEAEWAPALAEAFRWDGEAVVEAFVPGREWTVPILGDDTVLPLVEVRPTVKEGWYDFHAKYSDDAHTGYVFPQDDPADAELVARAGAVALLAYRAVGGRGMGRIDIRVRPDGTMAVLENNSIPGCTAHSILPKAAEKAGIPFPELCSRILESATCG